MKIFSGFLEDTNRLVPLPVEFFEDLLAQVDHLGELKVILFALGHIGRSGDYANCILWQDFTTDPKLMSSLGNNPAEAEAALQDCLARAVERGALIRVESSDPQGGQPYFYINSPRGRSAARILQQGGQSPAVHSPGGWSMPEKDNIFQLYEANFGPLTPMMAEMLKDAEKNHPPEWIEEAMHIAIQNNIRRWRYVEAILRSWKEEGRHGGDSESPQEDYRRYLKSRYASSGKQ